LFDSNFLSSSVCSTETAFSIDFVSSDENEIEKPPEICCYLKCTRKFSAEKIEKWTENATKSTFREKRNFLKSTADSYLKWNEHAGKFELDLHQDGIKICHLAFQQFHGISNYFLNKILRETVLAKENELELSLKTRDTLRKSVTVAALEIFLEENAQSLPNFDNKVVTTYGSKKAVFDELSKSVAFPSQIVKRRRFYQIWNEQFGNQLVKKVGE